MIGAWCKDCDTGFVVTTRSNNQVSALNRPEWSSSFPCIMTGCDGIAQRVTAGAALYCPSKCHEIPFEAFYRGLFGFGFRPGKPPAAEEEVRQLLLGQPIVDLITEQIGDPARTIILKMVLENGTKLHFAPSGRGACIYFVEEADDVALDFQSDSQEPAPDRVEAGRSPSSSQDEGQHDDSPPLLEGRGGPDVKSEGGVHLGLSDPRVSTADLSEVRTGAGGGPSTDLPRRDPPNEETK